jgi:23S rRNA pseudouridine2605 synthase
VAAMLHHPVQRLIRVRVGPIHLGELTAGEWRHLNEKELGKLKSGSRKAR